MSERVTDGIRRACGIAGGLTPNEFEVAEVRKVAVAEECDMLDEAVEAARCEMRPRLMPEGMEWLLEVWPRWSNGEYCRFGDWWTADRYGDYEPRQLRRLVIYTPELLDEWEQGDGESYGYEWNFMRPSELGYRPDKAEPPAPKVLAADGEPLEVGQTVWFVDSPHEATVEKIVRLVDGFSVYLKDDIDEYVGFSPSRLTHRAPILAADGIPLREGETVWDVETGDRRTVDRVFSGTTEPDFPGHTVACRRPDDVVTHMFEPSQLTHTKPEPLKRCRNCARWQKDPTADKMGVCWFFYHEHEGQDCYPARLGDIGACEEFMPRASALAERERGE